MKFTFKKSSYKNGNDAVFIYNENGEGYCEATINISKLPKGMAAIDVHSHPEVLDILLSAEILGRRLGSSHTFFCDYPIYELFLDGLKTL